jgi:hypothetical protein
MKENKKHYMMEKQNYLHVRERNRKIGMVSLVVLVAGMALNYAGRPEIGEHLIWLGIIMVVYTLGSNIIARSDMRKYEK